jgi:hypothetical protein
MVAEAAVKARILLAVAVTLAAALALTAGTARAADECKGLQVCVPVEGPWVTVSSVGVDWELACPLPGYVVGGTDARVATSDVDVSFRGEIGSPVGPGVTTTRSLVFHGLRTAGSGTSSFKPFIGCVPSRGGGGRALTGLTANAMGIKPRRPLFSVVVTASLVQRSQVVRAACPAPARLIGATHAVAFDQTTPPTAGQRSAVRVRRSVVEGVVVARVTATNAAGPFAKVQVRALCVKVR